MEEKKIDFDENIIYSGEPLKKWETLSLIGYLIVCNNQIHSYQIRLINSYLETKNNDQAELYVTHVLDHKKEKIGYDEAINFFSQEDSKIKKELCILLHGVASVDGLIDEDERRFFAEINRRTGFSDEKLKKLEALGNKLAIRIRESAEMENNRVNESESSCVMGEILKRVIKWVKLLLKKSESNFKSSVNEILYNTVIDDCSKIAKEDFEIIKPVYDGLLIESSKVCEELVQYKDNLKLANVFDKEISDVLNIFSGVIENEIHSQLSHYKKEIYRKEHALSDFTVSLVGRTKAGKTTLHSILTGEGKENIGIGMQRTTRYNRVYQWKRLRLIDTPGIGSAEADGRTDDQIAESVLSESDIICFLVVDDSIQQDILDFIEKILKRNKPIILLINHKENIRNEVRFKKYMKAPNEWIEESGENRIQGHIKRIERYVDSIGGSHLLKIYPVFLLGAIMADEDEYKSESIVLRESSRIDEFLDGLRSTITLNGSINRTQTIIDDTIGLFNTWNLRICDSILPINKLIESMKNKMEKANYVLEKAMNNNVKESKDYLNNKFEELAMVHALTFAEEYYNDKKNLDSNWKKFLVEIDFESDISRELGKYNKKYLESVEELISEILEDLEVTFKRINMDVSGFEFVSDFSFKSLINIFGTLVGILGGGFLLAGAGPVGWILTVAGIVINLVSLMFKSKKQKRQEAINKVYEQLKEIILDRKDNNINIHIDKITHNCQNVTKRVNDILSQLVKGLESLVEISNDLNENFNEKINDLNEVYAWRVINYLSNRKITLSKKLIDDEIFEVKRKYGEEIEIVTNVKNVVVNEGVKGVIKDRIKIRHMEDQKYG